MIAQTLKEVARQTKLEPLASGDPQYADVSAGRGSDDLCRLRTLMGDADASQNNFISVAFTGHRGCGKSTELLRLEHELANSLECLHLYVDETLVGDFDYTDLLLWMVDSLVRHFKDRDLALDSNLVEEISKWFAEKTSEDIEKVKSEVSLETEAEAKAKAGFYWLSLKLLARIKARILGSVEHRTVVRRQLQSYAMELVRVVNLLLDNAQNALEKSGKKAGLLIVQDNLDRLSMQVARKLFFDGGEFLKKLKAHFIYTVPIPMILAPWNINAVFDHTFTMPMIRVHDRRENDFDPGLDALTGLIAKRVVVEKVFSDMDVARHLAKMSGGSVRDFLRLVDYAQLTARTAGLSKIDRKSADQAVLKLRLDFERLLIPPQAYYPVLARIRANKQLGLPAGAQPNPDQVLKEREFFSQLLFNGSVLEYNGGQNWYDVHPVVHEIEAFQDALRQVRAENPIA